jgi:GxxExxY protein
MPFENYKHSDLTRQIIQAAYKVFNELGHGFLESVYEKSMELQLIEMGLLVQRQQAIPVYYKGNLVGDFKADLVVNNLVIIELKALKNLLPIHEVQLVNYLKATRIEVGLLINFGKYLETKRKVLSNDNK